MQDDATLTDKDTDNVEELLDRPENTDPDEAVAAGMAGWFSTEWYEESSIIQYQIVHAADWSKGTSLGRGGTVELTRKIATLESATRYTLSADETAPADGPILVANSELSTRYHVARYEIRPKDFIVVMANKNIPDYVKIKWKPGREPVPTQELELTGKELLQMSGIPYKPF